MPVYRYSGRSRKGKVRGKIEADDNRQALSLLSEQGIVVTSLEPELTLSHNKGLLRWLRPRVKPLDLAVFLRQFATMYAAGVPIGFILQATSEQAESRALKQALRKVRLAVMQGTALAEALNQHPRVFPRLMVNLVQVGEAGGTLEEVLERLAIFYQREHELGQKVATAMYYPVAVTIMAFFVSWLLIVRVVPTFIQSYAVTGARLPLPTRLLLGVSSTLRNYGLIIFAVLTALVIALRLFFAHRRGRPIADALKLKLPVFGRLVQLTALSRFCRVLATLQRSGVELLASLDLAATSLDNVIMAGPVQLAKARVSEGASIVLPLEESQYFPPMLVHMMRIGEESGSMDHMLERVADFYDRDIANMTERLTALLEPLITVVLAVVVGAILLAVVMPMFDMMRMIK